MRLGIIGFGAYLPRLRLQRQAIAQANGWFNAGLKGLAKGERTMANWDEDVVTMAVEAARDALGDRPRDKITAVFFASTTFPFLDRLNAAIVAEALSLNPNLRALDIAASQRGATSALIDALEGRGRTLVVAAEKRPALAASPSEMSAGDGAAAMLVGEGDSAARLLGWASRTVDFVDHYRTPEHPTDYPWEERWIRTAGYGEIAPPAIADCLAGAGVKPADIAHFVMPAAQPRLAEFIAKTAQLPPTSIVDSLLAVCGDTGAAHALLMLASTLEKAKPGEKILVVGFGQGADALLLEAGPSIAALAPRFGVSGHLARRKPENQYSKFVAFNDVLLLDRGMRAETDKQTALSAQWRNRQAVTSFIGGLCGRCGARQFPKTRICVAPGCGAIDSQTPEPFAEKIGVINSYTADRLTYSPDPPSCYGMIEFTEGGRWMMDFTDVEADDLEVGARMKMMFRIKDFDTQRGYRRYFWKAAPHKTLET